MRPFYSILFREYYNEADFMVSFAFDDGGFFLEKVMRVDIDNFESGGELVNHRDAPWIEDLLGKLIEF